jgi:hypothetical protein
MLKTFSRKVVNVSKEASFRLPQSTTAILNSTFHTSFARQRLNVEIHPEVKSANLETTYNNFVLSDGATIPELKQELKYINTRYEDSLNRLRCLEGKFHGSENDDPNLEFRKCATERRAIKKRLFDLEHPEKIEVTSHNHSENKLRR